MGEVFHSTFTPEGQQALKTELQITPRQAGRHLNTLLVAKKLAGLYRNGFQGDLSHADADIYYVLHGEHAKVLANKNDFVHIVRDIGHTAPESMVVGKEGSPETRAKEIKAYFGQRGIEHLFVKPLNGTRQRDLHPTERDASDLSTHLEAHEELVVQERIPHDRVLRYIRYQDRNGENFVACFSYQEPPEGTKQKKIPVVGSKHVNASGETLNELATNLLNTSAATLEHEGIQPNNLNIFMAKFITKLEQELGGSLPFASFDIAVRDMPVLTQALSQPYSDDVETTLRENLVFIESQSLPNPWEIRPHNTSKPMQTYVRLWRLFLKEYAQEMLPRIKQLHDRHVV